MISLASRREIQVMGTLRCLTVLMTRLESQVPNGVGV
jgi:hypothetical protein